MKNVSTMVSRRPDQSMTWSQRTARNLGWFSIGLGLAEIIAPGRLARALGLEGKENLLRGYGAREIGAGVWALSDTPAPAIWSRFAGDLLDLGTLAVGLREGNQEQRKYAGIAIAAVAGVTLVDLLTAATLSHEFKQDRGETRDYSDRSGFPRGVADSRGAAEGFTPVDFQVTATSERSAAEQRSGSELQPA
jgi:hypothetical protein